MSAFLHPLRKPPPSTTVLRNRVGRGSGGSRPFPPGLGEALDPDVRRRMEHGFGHDLSGVRVHAGRDADLAARVMDAAAFTSGTNIGFAHGRYDPSSAAGRALLAHELAHVVQQTGRARPGGGTGAALEAEAEAAADAVALGRDATPLSSSGPGVQLRVEMRRLGRGQHSGYEQLPQLIKRLNGISTALIFHVDAAGVLDFTENPYGTETEFDRQMRSLIRDPRVIPLRLTNRHGRMYTDADSYPTTHWVEADDYRSGYVDMDDLLTSDDLALQATLIHFLTERIETRSYVRRMGAEERDSAGALVETFPAAEFRRAHALGIDAEMRFMRDYFGDPAIAFLSGTPGDVVLQLITGRPAGAGRRDVIRLHMTPSGRGSRRGLNSLSIDILLSDGQVMSAPAYRALLQRERAARAAPVQNRAAPMVGPQP